MNPPLISVVMPVRNVERFLPEAIESILGQSFTNFEFIIVDFGSTDDSKLIVSRYAAKDERIKPLEIPPCTLPAARNAGCQIARGKYIAVMDADDMALPNRLLAQIECMEANPEIGLLGGAVEWIDSVGRSDGIRHGNPTQPLRIKSELAFRCTFWHPTVLLRKDAFAALGGYRSAFVCAHDYDLALRFAEGFACANLEQVLVRYRVHPGQLSFEKQSQQTLCKLAARASAALRAKRLRDPLDETTNITPQLLISMGVDEATQRAALLKDCHDWVRLMAAAQKHAECIDAAEEMLGRDLTYVPKWQIASLRLTVAGLYWKQGKYAMSCLAGVRALLVRPVLVLRPIRLCFRRFLARQNGGSNLTTP
jgi:hypothetical protein